MHNKHKINPLDSSLESLKFLVFLLSVEAAAAAEKRHYTFKWGVLCSRVDMFSRRTVCIGCRQPSPIHTHTYFKNIYCHHEKESFPSYCTTTFHFDATLLQSKMTINNNADCRECQTTQMFWWSLLFRNTTFKEKIDKCDCKLYTAVIWLRRKCVTCVSAQNWFQLFQLLYFITVVLQLLAGKGISRC